MGCKYACVCYGGPCPSCTRYEPEEYYGHAEDIADQQAAEAVRECLDKFHEKNSEK